MMPMRRHILKRNRPSVGRWSGPAAGLLLAGLVVSTQAAWAQPDEPSAAPTSDMTTPAEDATAAPASLSVPSVEVLRRLRQTSPTLTPNQLLEQASSSFIDQEFDRYRLGPGDSIFVSVQRFPDLSFSATLDVQGNIVIPIQGAVSFEGLTLEEAETKLRGIYNQYVVIRELNPNYTGPADVTLTLTAQRGVEVTIVGDVQRPGFYPLPDNRVVTALLVAGGSTGTADLRNIRVERRLRDGTTLEETVDLFTPLKEGRALPDVRLEDGDVMYIPRLDDADWVTYDRYLVSRSTLGQPEITIRFINYAVAYGGGLGSNSNLGAIRVPNGTSLIDAVTLIGVNPDLAQLNQVALYRFSPESGRPVQLLVDAVQGFNGNPAQDPPLEDNDVIIVGRNFISKVNYALNVVTQPFRDVLGFIFFIDSIDDIFN